MSPEVPTNGAGIYMTGGSILNCTIVGNTGAGGDTGAELHITAGSVSNSIIYFNGASTPASTNQNVRMTGGLIGYSAMEPLVGGTNNISDDPRFLATNVANYRLSGRSPCIGAGREQTWMMGALDLDGSLRIQFGGVDMGAYESPPTCAAILMMVR